ncbi:MAG TPA: 23S rRNA (pseudouridine(1915)-N(3))-methyltransferase RlmH, partial [Candidatus Berkiella sp.]|nr:23S rRNA (pseudouridine(1915)-N(3))-methyltransferase RlmH [Candidatus Berkiella sp.]
KLLQKNSPTDKVIALDVQGQAFSTQTLATNIANWQQEGNRLVFLIGGPDGLSEACLKRANVKWSLSMLTFPHVLARVILLEQLYRATSLLANHPYHRE